MKFTRARVPPPSKSWRHGSHFNRGEKAGAGTPKRAMTEFMRMSRSQVLGSRRFSGEREDCSPLTGSHRFFHVARLVPRKKKYGTVRNLASVK